MPKSNGSNGKGPSLQHMGGKPTEKERRQRFRDALELHARGYRPREIRAALQDKWGMCGRVADRYARSARDSAIKYSQVPVEVLIAQSHATYLSILRDPKATHQSRISAQKAIDDLYGLQKARKVALTTTDGQDVIQTVVDRLSPELLEAFDQIATLVEAVERGEVVEPETPSPQLLEGPEVT